jgi:hypothetical protein
VGKWVVGANPVSITLCNLRTYEIMHFGRVLRERRFGKKLRQSSKIIVIDFITKWCNI